MKILGHAVPIFLLMSESSPSSGAKKVVLKARLRRKRELGRGAPSESESRLLVGVNNFVSLPNVLNASN